MKLGRVVGLLGWLAWGLGLHLHAAPAAVLINEIMYHPLSETPREEYVELHNPAAAAVDVGGWRFTSGLRFQIPSNTVISPHGFLVVAADREAFAKVHPTVTNVVGSWVEVRVTDVLGRSLTNYLNILSNRRNRIELVDTLGQTVDTVTYADEGDWAERRRGPNDLSRRGWIWHAPHDGLGKSLELINPALPNELGQNWAASGPTNGTPGRANSVVQDNIAPMILEARHFPPVPRSNDTVSVTARIVDESPGDVTMTLHYRVDSVTPTAFTSTPMLDDGAHADGAPVDGLFGAFLPPRPNNAVVEFYLEASDDQGARRTWPAPVWAALDGAGPTGQVANALYQVDENLQNAYGGVPSLQPVYKMIMTENERVELAGIPCTSSQNSDAQMNGTFISLDGTETLVRYLCGFRNRGHGSRCATPPNYRVNFRSDEPWKGVTGLNVNSRQTHVQHFGSTLALKAGVSVTESRAVQVRVNNANLADSGSPMYGSYAANEAYGADWAERHFPFDRGGNLYMAVRDINPSEFDYRTRAAFPSLYGPESARSYTNTWFKETNVSENEWNDLIGMLSVMGLSGNVPFTNENVRQVIQVEQWLRHLAFVAMVVDSESGLNTGHNDDYFLYRGVNDPRFILSLHDLDQMFSIGGQTLGGTNDTLFGATTYPPRGTSDDDGSGRAMNRFLRSPDYEPIYYGILQELLDTTFAKPQFDALLDQTLSPYVPPSVITSIKTWMDGRRASVQTQIAGRVPPRSPRAWISGEPRSPTPWATATLHVGGADITHYRFKLNDEPYSPVFPVSEPIRIPGRPDGSSNIVFVIGQNSSNLWQSTSAPTPSKPWIVDLSLPPVRLNEVLARNVAAVNHHGTSPDLIEIHNEGAVPWNLAGLRLTDDPASPGGFVFPPGASLAAGSNLVLCANDPDGTPGIHLGFALNQDGDGVYLFAPNGRLIDSVTFGLQLPDLALGRLGDSGEWVLCQPTFGAANTPQPVGDPRNLRVNEWLAAPQGLFGDDFVEVLNLDALPVGLGGLYLTDEPIGAPRLHPVTPLSFIGARAWLSFTADGDPERGADHLGFQLASEQGRIGLLDEQGTVIDCVAYGPQRSGISQGRCPDGSLAIRTLVQPTPGFANHCPIPPPTPVTDTLLPITNVWKYDQTTATLPGNWKAPDFDDRNWPSGPGLLGVMRSGGTLPEPIRTPLILGRVSYYFRTRFTLPEGVPFTTLQIRHVIDDGAVFYLNGTELPRYNMPTGLITNSTTATENILDSDYRGPIPLPPSLIVPGTNVLAVEVHQNRVSSADVIFGLVLEGLIITNTPAAAGVVINEVLADNASLAEPDGSTPDGVELYNPSTNAVDLAGLSLADFAQNRWTFPPASIIPANGYLVVRCDADHPASATNTGFGLKRSGDTLYLFNAPPNAHEIVDWLQFGVQIADFSVGRLPDGSGVTNLTLPTLGAANLPAPLGEVARLKVNEWMAAPASGDDWFELFNPNPQPVALGGCFLTDKLNNPTKHAIAPLSFIGAQTNAWLRFWADEKTPAGADHVNFKLDADREAVGLANPAGVSIDAISFGSQQSGVSQGRMPDGAAPITLFPGTASPGEANFLLLTNVVVNEVLSHSDEPLEDAIELRNLSATPVDLSGWWLSDARSVPRKYQIPGNTIIPGGDYRVFYENQFNNPDAAAAPFALSSTGGDQVYLSAATNGGLTGYRVWAEFGPSANGVSFGRWLTSVGVDFVPMARRTFGVDWPVTVEDFRQGQGLSNAAPKVGPIVIRQIMYHPPALGPDDNVRDEFLVLQNVTPDPVPLFDPAFPSNTWQVTSGVDFVFPPAITLPPGASVTLVSFDPFHDAAALTAFQHIYSSNAALLGPYAGKLDNGGERIVLEQPDPPQLLPGPDLGLVPLVSIERIVYADRLPWPTNADGYGAALLRQLPASYGNEPTNWIAVPPALPSVGDGDADQDGLPNGWETAFGLNPYSPADANQDLDGDGSTNLQEYAAGTDPRVRDLRLVIEAVALGGGEVRISFVAAAGLSYTVVYRHTLGSETWFRLADIPPKPTTELITVIDTAPSLNPQRFYQVISPRLP
jgi:hypothetical protein